VALVVAVLCLWAAPYAGGGEGAAAGTSGAAVTKKVSVEASDASLQDVLRLVFRGTDQSFIVDPGIDLTLQRVTLTLKEVTLEQAVRAICRLYGLEYETVDEGVWLITAGKDVVISGGRVLPLLGAVRAAGGPANAEALAGWNRQAMEEELRRVGAPEDILQELLLIGPGRTASRLMTAKLPEHPERVSDVLVDLSVEDATMAEVAEKLTAAVDAAVKLPAKEPEDAHVLEIRIHKAIPEELRITARVYRMPLSEVLEMLMQQANLTWSLERSGWGYYDPSRPNRAPLRREEGLSDQEWTNALMGKGIVAKMPLQVLHIVPQPELSVSGPGIGPRGGAGGQAGGRGGGGIAGHGGGFGGSGGGGGGGRGGSD